MNSAKINKALIILCTTLFIVIMLILARTALDENLKVVQGKSVSLKDSWTVYHGETKLENVSIPTDLNLDRGEIFEATTVMPKESTERDYLLLRSSMQNIKVYIENSEIYRYKSMEGEGVIKRPWASIWLLVKLPEGHEGKQLKLSIESPVSSFSGVINEVKLGAPHVLLYELVQDKFLGLLVFIGLFFIGAAITLMSFFTKTSDDNRLLYLGLLGITSSAWVLSEARLMQFFTANRFIIGGISYVMNPIIGIFLTLYLKEEVIVEKRNKLLMQIIAVGYGTVLFASIVLQVLGIKAFIESLRFTFILILVNTVAIFVIMIFELVRKKNKEVKRIFKHMTILVISALLEGVVFYFEKFNYTSSFLRIGILIFFGLLLRDYYIYFRETVEKQKEHDVLEKLAYKDFLTGGFNRAAFERDIEDTLESYEGIFRLVLIDINDLKYINDNYGHSHGDDAIRKVHMYMEESFINVGVCYRIGGDEFAIIMKDADCNMYEKCTEKLREALESEEKNLLYPMDIAMGSSIYYSNEREEYTKFYHYVDQKMYSDKVERKKSRRKIKGDFRDGVSID